MVFSNRNTEIMRSEQNYASGIRTKAENIFRLFPNVRNDFTIFLV